MTELLTRPAADRRALGLAAFLLLVAGLAVAGTAASCNRSLEPVPAADPPDADTGAADPRTPFANWPKDAKPDAVIVLSGETFGYVQPCGCSKPQKGGLERRANLIASLKAKGWPVVGADLGDLYPDRKPVGPPGLVTSPEQAALKYTAALSGLRDMGYVAVGAGKTDFAAGLTRLTAEYALQKEQPPYTLAGNVLGRSDGKTVPRPDYFPPAPGGTRPLVGLLEVAEDGKLSVGVVGVVGKAVSEDGRKADKLIEFEDTHTVLGRAVTELAARPKKPAVNVLLFQGSAEDARAAAKDRPEFRVVLCKSDDPEPPQYPDVITHPDGRTSLIIQVGHKGMYVGVVGVFNRPGKPPALKYQLVLLGEEYLTPAGAEAAKGNAFLPLLEEYARAVKDRDFLAKAARAPHAAQLQQPALNLSYVGSAKCAGCHPGEHAKWSSTKHSHAMEALEQAVRPGLRQFDPECVVCHAVGYGYKTGYVSADKTPALKHNGCENCHGPGSGHAADERNPELLALLAPWKGGDRAAKLPEPAFLDKLAKLGPTERGQVPIPPAQNKVMIAVSGMCQKCHDGENDPHFDLYTYWPKVVHSGLGGAAPGK